MMIRTPLFSTSSVSFRSFSLHINHSLVLNLSTYFDNYTGQPLHTQREKEKNKRKKIRTKANTIPTLLVMDNVVDISQGPTWRLIALGDAPEASHNASSPPPIRVLQLSDDLIRQTQADPVHDVGLHPEPIDNKRRFRYLFFGLLAIFMSSSYGTYVVFGLYLQLLYRFRIMNIVDVFVVGTAAGLGFAALAGFFLDYVGHRVTIGYATLICFFGMLFMGLTFDGYFDVTEPTMDGLFFLMNAGGYAVDVVAIITSVTHFPRNRGMVCGLYKSLGGLGASFFSCLFRGYLKSSLPKMFYAYIGVMGVFAIIVLIFYAPAPWVNFRFHRTVRVLRANPSTVLDPSQLNEIRSRMAEYFNLKVPFMKYHIPQRRIRITFFVLMLLNVFMTTQILLIAYKEITSRGILDLFSTIAVVIILFLMDYTEDNMDMDEDGRSINHMVIENPLVTTPGASTTSVGTGPLFHGITREVFSSTFTPAATTSLSPQEEEIGQTSAPKQGKREDINEVVTSEIEKLTPDNRLALNYDSVTELIKYRGATEALMSPEFWILMFLSFIVWSTGLILTNNLFIQIMYTSIDKKSMDTKVYYLYSALSGILIATGRMAIGLVADDIMPILRVKLRIPFSLPFTLLLIVAPWVTFFGLFLAIVVPGVKGLLAAYVFLSFGFGLTTSTVPYAVTCFFSFEHVGLGKMYGSCLFAVGAGVAVFYRGLFYTEYDKKAYPMDFPIPQVRGVCITGKKDCVQTFLIVLLVLNFLAGVLAVVLHILYQRKIRTMTRHLVVSIVGDSFLALMRYLIAICASFPVFFLFVCFTLNYCYNVFYFLFYFLLLAPFRNCATGKRTELSKYSFVFFCCSFTLQETFPVAAEASLVSLIPAMLAVLQKVKGKAIQHTYNPFLYLCLVNVFVSIPYFACLFLNGVTSEIKECRKISNEGAVLTIYVCFFRMIHILFFKVSSRLERRVEHIYIYYYMSNIAAITITQGLHTGDKAAKCVVMFSVPKVCIQSCVLSHYPFPSFLLALVFQTCLIHTSPYHPLRQMKPDSFDVVSPTLSRSAMTPSPIRVLPLDEEAIIRAQANIPPEGRAVLESPEKRSDGPINNKRRFRYLFLGLLAILMGSGYGMYAVFGLYLMRLYGFKVKHVVDIFAIGTAGGLGFAAVAGFLFDYVGHRITIAYSTLLCLAGMVLMGLQFDGYIDLTEDYLDAFFFLMNAGGYAIDVVAIVTSVTHFPRNRGMVCGLYKSLGGLAASLFSCLFRGYLNSSLPKMFYLYCIVTAVLVIIVLIFYAPAPWVNFRFHRTVRVLRANPSTVLDPSQLNEIRSRMAEYFNLKVPFMKYHIPQRRIRITFFVLMLLNMFMTAQILLIAYKEITSRGILDLFSTIAVVITLFLSVLAWPFDCLDEKMDYTEDSIDVGEDGEPIQPHPALNDNPLFPDLVRERLETSMTSIHSFTHGFGITQQVVSGVYTADSSTTGSDRESEETGAVGEKEARNDGEETVEHVVTEEIEKLTPDNRLALNYDSVTELIKHRKTKDALLSAEFWILMFLSFIVWSTGLILTNNLFIQIMYTSIDKKSMDTKVYYLYSALSGILIAGGRMAIGLVADDIMPILRVKLRIPFSLPFTLLLIVAPWVTFFGLFLAIVVPGVKGLLAAYVFLSFGFGLTTSTVPYAVTCFFSFEHVGLGKMYGSCLFAVGAGVAVFYRGLFYTEYDKKAYPMDFPIPQVRGVCITGKKDCVGIFLVVLLGLNVVAGVLAVVLHVRYTRRIHAMVKELSERLQLSMSAIGDKSSVVPSLVFTCIYGERGRFALGAAVLAKMWWGLMAKRLHPRYTFKSIYTEQEISAVCYFRWSLLSPLTYKIYFYILICCVYAIEPTSYSIYIFLALLLSLLLSDLIPLPFLSTHTCMRTDVGENILSFQCCSSICFIFPIQSRVLLFRFIGAYFNRERERYGEHDDKKSPQDDGSSSEMSQFLSHPNPRRASPACGIVYGHSKPWQRTIHAMAQQLIEQLLLAYSATVREPISRSTMPFLFKKHSLLYPTIKYTRQRVVLNLISTVFWIIFFRFFCSCIFYYLFIGVLIYSICLFLWLSFCDWDADSISDRDMLFLWNGDTEKTQGENSTNWSIIYLYILHLYATFMTLYLLSVSLSTGIAFLQDEPNCWVSHHSGSYFFPFTICCLLFDLSPAFTGHFASPMDLPAVPQPEGSRTPTQADSNHEPAGEIEPVPQDDLYEPNKAIKKEPIDNRRRFRYLFFGLLAIFMSSSYGTYVVFGLYLQLLYRFRIMNIVDVFVVGTAAGLGFAALAGFLLDYVGHRVTIGYATLICFFGMLFMGLTFDGYFDVTEPTMDGLFFLMNAGGYAIDVVAIVTSVTHFPRNRGMVCGLYKSLGGLAASFFSCLFRGYLKSSLSKMFYAYVGIMGVFAIIVLIFYAPAPWVNFRFHRAVRILRARSDDVVAPDQLHEIRSRMAEYFNLKVPFMKYHIPQRRIRITFFVLMLLNVFMTTQILLIAYKEITSRGILNLFSTIALILVLLLTILAWPFDFLDEEVDYTQDNMDIDRDGNALFSQIQRSNSDYMPRPPVRSMSTISTASHRGVTHGVFGQSVSNSPISRMASTEIVIQEPETTSVPRETLENVVTEEIDNLTPDNRLALNYDSVTELIKYRGGPIEALMSPEFWILMFLSFIVWSTGLILTNNLFIQIMYTSIDKKSMDTKVYYLYSALSGILIAGGRMAIGLVADDIMPILRVKLRIPFSLPFTLLLIVAPWLTFFGLLLAIVVPGVKGLLAAYVFLSFGFGLTTSTVPYAVTCFFSFEHVGLGKMYGSCLFAVGAGVAVFYRGLFYTEYDKKAYPMDFPIPQVRGVCITGKKDCVQTFLIVLLCLNVVAGCLAVVLHVRYQRRINVMTKQLLEILQLSYSIAVSLSILLCLRSIVRRNHNDDPETSSVLMMY
eukprot:gene745-393_t